MAQSNLIGHSYLAHEYNLSNSGFASHPRTKSSSYIINAFPLNCETYQVYQCNHSYVPSIVNQTCQYTQNIPKDSDQHVSDSHIRQEELLSLKHQQPQDDSGDKFLYHPKLTAGITLNHQGDSKLPPHQDLHSKHQNNSKLQLYQDLSSRHQGDSTLPLHHDLSSRHQSDSKLPLRPNLHSRENRRALPSPHPIWLSLVKRGEAATTPRQPFSGNSDYQAATELMSTMEALRNKGSSRPSVPPCSKTLLTEEELHSALPTQDMNEILNLQKLYFEAFSLFPTLEKINNNETDRLWQLYSLFVERQSSFFGKIPSFRLLATCDRHKLLRLAVGISIHLSAAQLMDEQEYTWPRRDAPLITTHTRVLSASTIRQVVSHEHFILLMTFYTHYTRLFADPRVVLLTQVLSLFCEVPELSDVDAIRQRRQHYLGLLSRYLTTVYGRQPGERLLTTLLVSQEEARQLSAIYQHVELSPQVQRYALRSDAPNVFTANFQKLCIFAHSIVAAKVKDQRHDTSMQASDSASMQASNSTSMQASGSTSMQASDNTSMQASNSNVTDQVTVLKKLLTRLACHDDPHMLAAARHVLPLDLLQHFLQIMQ
ncbi:hypothetical protein OTU49_007919 [Cherax quadricarinatus]|uniref:Uncharacterized protein n=1 Tax=Cherax quadricarinatus TaxID=27406 RepID=A0AAW0WU55_CHEQU